jgi:hypothetical protein
MVPEVGRSFLVVACACVMFVGGGCSIFGEKEPPPPDHVVVRTMDFRGWTDAVRMTNGEYEVVIVPQIARIMKYGKLDGENVLWVNDELVPDNAGEMAAESGDWQNFGGYKLWPAPQEAWNWPPDWSLDRGPCTADLLPDGSVKLIGKPSPELGIRFDRVITLAAPGDPIMSRLQIQQIVTNVSEKPVTASIWDVTQVKDDCVGFVPLEPRAQYRTWDGAPPDAQWSRLGDMAFVKPMGIDGKLFFPGRPGFLGCLWGDQIYVKVLETADAAPPEPETPREVYTGSQGYVELECVGPAVTLQPGESSTFKVDWYLVPAGTNTGTAEGMLETIAALVETLPEPVEPMPEPEVQEEAPAEE